MGIEQKDAEFTGLPVAEEEVEEEVVEDDGAEEEVEGWGTEEPVPAVDEPLAGGVSEVQLVTEEK